MLLERRRDTNIQALVLIVVVVVVAIVFAIVVIMIHDSRILRGIVVAPVVSEHIPASTSKPSPFKIVHPGTGLSICMALRQLQNPFMPTLGGTLEWRSAIIVSRVGVDLFLVEE